MVILIKATIIITLDHLIAIWEPEKYYVCGTVLHNHIVTHEYMVGFQKKPKKIVFFIQLLCHNWIIMLMHFLSGDPIILLGFIYHLRVDNLQIHIFSTDFSLEI